MPPKTSQRNSAGKKRSGGKSKTNHEDVYSEFSTKCERFRRYYSAVDREEWWWIMDDSQEAIAEHLNSQGHCVIDNFLTPAQARQLKKEVVACHAAGHLAPGGLVNGKLPSVDDSKYADRTTRGDVIGWFEGSEEEWPHGRMLDSYMLKLGTFISELSGGVPELKKVTSRSKAMAACYPGGGARYIKHVDNDGSHALCRTRLLTALIYLNDDWRDGDGGELAVFNEDDPDSLVREVQPLGNRLLIFWSDKRTPHEVRPSHKMRYSVTVWLLDNTKKHCSDGASEPPPALPSEPSAAPVEEECTKQDSEPAEKLPDKSEPADKFSDKISQDAATPPAKVEANENGVVRYEWKNLGASSDGGEAWELQLELLGESPAECPQLELSDSQVRALSSSGDLLVCLPLPAASLGTPAPKWSRKKRLLAVQFQSLGRTCSPSLISAQSASLASQLRTQGWGILDSFLPGPEADELRHFLLTQRALGRLRHGTNAHEGPTGAAAGDKRTRDAIKNDQYTFLDGQVGGGASASSGPVKALSRRCNQLLAKLVGAGPDGIPELQGRRLCQGDPMLAVYPGDGARYGRHYDSTEGGKGANGRVLTLIAYLNPFWRKEHGGCLRLLEQLADDAATANDIEPLHGRVVAFLCKDRNPHEVLPSWADRAAVTIWYYDGDRLVDRCSNDTNGISGFAFEGGNS